MVHYHKKQDSGDLHPLLPSLHPKYKPTLLRLFLLFSFFSLSFILAAAVLLFTSYDDQQPHQENAPCSSVANNTVCCDRTAKRADLCYMRGDVRTDASSSSVFLCNSNTTRQENIRPYTRKWEADTMSRIDELRLRPINKTGPACDVVHDVPAVFFSTGGYTGNVYHEFNDGIIPLYITSQKFDRKVVFVILEYHDWWISKYENILSKLSDFDPIDFSSDKRVHCFPEAVAGLKIHDELAVDSTKMESNKTIRDFRNLLDESYKPRIEYIKQEEGAGNKQQQIQTPNSRRPELVIVSRNGSRGIENERELVKLATKIGFRVEVLRPDRTTELAKIYRSLNSSDVMVGVHGAAMTHLLFMRPGTVFIQIVPLGTDWAAETYYGEPAKKLGLEYMGYKILPTESSLYREYEKDDAVLRDPESVNARGWEVTKRVYLDGQNVRLDLQRFRKRLVNAYEYLILKKQRRYN